MKNTQTPLASIIIRSKNRLPELKKLLLICLEQNAPSFEIVIVDSSEGISDKEFLDTLSIQDEKIRILRTPPKGCAAAANEGVRFANGEILVFVDDDDIPIGNEWLSAHLRNFDDPACLGVNGRMYYEGEITSSEIKNSLHAERWMLSFGFWKNTRWFASFPFRKVGIDFLMGGNASLRRCAYEKGKGWDEFLPYHNECSLFLRLQKQKRSTEYLVYDPKAKMRIRRDIPGGVEQRNDHNIRRFVDTLAKYYLWVVAPSYPFRIYGLFPLFFRYFCLSSAKAAKQFIQTQSDDKKPAKQAYWKALQYAPISLVKHSFFRKVFSKPSTSSSSFSL